MWPWLCVQWRKRDPAEIILAVIISSWPRCQKRSKTERILAVLWFLSCVNCISSRTVSTEETYQQPQSGSGARLLRGKKVEDLVVNKIPREWVSLEDFNNPNNEIVWKRFWWLPIRIQKWIKRIIGWSISRRVDIWLYNKKWNHNKKFHHFLMGQHPGSNTRSWSKIGWTLQC